MENDKRLPTGWHWKITPEQIEKIKERDRDTVNKVYFDNYEKFKRMANHYCYIIINRPYLVDDCLHQIYVDMLDYDYTNTLTLWFSLRHSFWSACCIDKRCNVSLDEPLCADSETILGDVIPSGYDITKEVENKENERHALEIIAAQTHLTDRQKDILTAITLGCLAYQGIFDYEYRQAIAP